MFCKLTKTTWNIYIYIYMDIYIYICIYIYIYIYIYAIMDDVTLGGDGRARCFGNGRNGFADWACTQSFQERAHNTGKWDSYSVESQVSDVWILSSRHGQRLVARITNTHWIGHELYLVGKSWWSRACHEKTMGPRSPGCITDPPLSLQQP